MITNLIAFAMVDRVLLSWPEVKGVDVYTVFRDNEYLATVTATNHVDVINTNEDQHTYHVVPGIVECVMIRVNDDLSVDHELPAPDKVNANWIGDQLYCSWQPVEGSTGYILYVNGHYSGMTRGDCFFTLKQPVVNDVNSVSIVAFVDQLFGGGHNSYSPMSVIARPRYKNTQPND